MAESAPRVLIAVSKTCVCLVTTFRHYQWADIAFGALAVLGLGEFSLYHQMKRPPQSRARI